MVVHAIYPEVWELKKCKTANVTFKDTQGLWCWCHSIGHVQFPISLYSSYVPILYCFRDIISYFRKLNEVT